MAASPDSGVGHFYSKTDLTVDQPVNLRDSNFFKCRQTKDEDVQIVNGALTVVSTEVTTITQKLDKGSHSYDYADFKKEVKAFAKSCKDAGAKLNGEVVVYADGDKYFRLKVTDNVVKIEGAVLGWPSGGTTPKYEDWPSS